MSDLLAGLPLEQRIVIVQEANRLLAGLPDCKAKAFAEKIKPTYLPDRGKVSNSKLKIGLYPLGAMLHSRPNVSLPRQQERDWLRGWALVAALRFCSDFRSDDHHSRLTTGLRVVRRLTAGGYKLDLMSEVQTLDGTLPQSLQALRGLAQTLLQRGEDWEAELNQLDLLLRGGQVSIVPRYVESSTRRSFENVEKLPERVLQDRGISIVQSGEVPLADDVPPEEQSEELSDRFYDFGATYRALQPIAALQEAQLTLLERDAEPIGLQGGFASLTQEEMAQLFKAALRDAAHGDKGAKWVLASMASGRSIAELSMAGRIAVAGSTWLIDGGGIAFAPDVRFMAHPAKGGYALYPPKALSNWLDWDRVGKAPKQAAEDWLHSQKNGRTHRLSRVERALEDALLLSGADRAAAGLLAGRSTRAVIQLHYARFPVSSLRMLWLKALAECFGSSEGFRLEPLDPKRYAIGSLVVPDSKNVAQWFVGLFDKVKQARARRADGVFHMVDVVAAEANLAAWECPKLCVSDLAHAFFR